MMLETIKKIKIENQLGTSMLELLNDNLIISTIDTLGRYIYVNNNFCSIYGLSADKILGETQSVLGSHLHRGKVYKDLWKTVKTGKSWKGVLKFKSKKGFIFWLDTTVIPLNDFNGNIEKYVIIHVDITSSQISFLQSKNNEQKLNSYIESIPTDILSVNQKGEILNSNHKVNNLGISEIIGTSYYTYIDSEYHKKVEKVMSLVFNDGISCEYETIWKNENGLKSHFITQIGPVFNEQGRVTSAIISAQNVTKLFNEKEDLRMKEAKYRTLFQSINIGIIMVTDEFGNITEWNAGAEKSFGYSAHEIIGNPLTEIISINHSKYNMQGLVKIVEKLKKSTFNDVVEMKGINKNNQEFPVQMALNKWEEDEKKYYCAMMLDVSKSKNLETKLNQKKEELEMFLYRSSHDLKAPLVSAEGLIGLLKEENINFNEKKLINMLSASIDRGIKIVNNLAQVSVISESQNEISKINFNELISDILLSFQGFKNYSKIDFIIDIINECEYYGNELLLSSLFQNLIQNGIKYCSFGLSTEKPYVKISILCEMETLKILVSDNGLGIEDKHHDKIFSMYYRANVDVEGTGLGLYIVDNIVEELGGSIQMKSKLNHGTSFEIVLPRIKMDEK